MPKVTFHYNGQVKVMEAKEGKTILQIALDSGIPMEHACGGNGFCTTCMCGLRDGDRALAEGRVTDATDREEAMGIDVPLKRLSCQTKVHGDIEVNVDPEV